MIWKCSQKPYIPYLGLPIFSRAFLIWNFSDLGILYSTDYEFSNYPSKYLFLQQIGSVMFNPGRLFLRQQFPTVWLCLCLRIFLHVHVTLANYCLFFLSPYLLQSLLIPLQSSKNSNVLVGFSSLTQFSKNSLNQGHWSYMALWYYYALWPKGSSTALIPLLNHQENREQIRMKI